jgi:excisionase family DNA binding protein
MIRPSDLVLQTVMACAAEGILLRVVAPRGRNRHGKLTDPGHLGLIGNVSDGLDGLIDRLEADPPARRLFQRIALDGGALLETPRGQVLIQTDPKTGWRITWLSEYIRPTRVPRSAFSMKGGQNKPERSPRTGRNGGHKMDELLTVDELAERLKVSPNWIYSKVYSRELPHVKVGRHLRFDAADVERVIQRVPARPKPIRPVVANPKASIVKYLAKHPGAAADAIAADVGLSGWIVWTTLKVLLEDGAIHRQSGSGRRGSPFTYALSKRRRQQ